MGPICSPLPRTGIRTQAYRILDLLLSLASRGLVAVDEAWATRRPTGLGSVDADVEELAICRYKL